MTRFVLSAIGEDRPGIVASLAGALGEHQCNLLDSQMNQLDGQFAMMLALEAPDAVEESDIRSTLAGVMAEFDLVTLVRKTQGQKVTTPDDDTPSYRCVVSVQGADRIGIVAGVSRVLGDHGCNIADMRTFGFEGSAGPGYVMNLEVDVPAELRLGDLEAALLRSGDELGVSCMVRSQEVEGL